MIRAVLDTNVIISALLFGGPTASVLVAWQRKQFILLASQHLVAEIIRVLHYLKFHLSRDDIRYLLEHELLPFITPVTVTRVPRVIRADPSDNHVLACASAGKAGVIVTGDHHLLALRRYRAIPLITPAAFLRQLSLPRL